MFSKFVVGGIAIAIMGGAVSVGAAPIAGAQPYEDCTEARRDGASDIPSDSPYYGPHLDSDDDGIGCEA